MTNKSSTQGWGILLVFLGILFLATNFGWFGWLTSWLWSLIFIGAGATFLYLYYQNRERWWALIPGFALLAIGVAALSGHAAGGLFLTLLGTGFAAVYLSNHKRWWAIIPAGGLFTLALIAWSDAIGPGWDNGWMFFLGIAATFGILFFLPESRGKQRWAIYPALGSLALVLLAMFSSSVGSTVIALVLVAVGVYLFWQRRNDKTDIPINTEGPNQSGTPQPH